MKITNNQLIYYFLSISAVFFVTVLSFQCGFYWDDWNFHTIIYNRDSEDIKSFFGADRFLVAYSKLLTKILIPENPIYFQGVLILAKLIFALILYYFIKTIKICKDKNILYAIPFLVFFFPGFSQDSISLTYGFGFIIYSTYIVSFLITYFALDKKDDIVFYITLSTLSLITMIFLLLHGEYLLGMEVYRLIFIFHYFKSKLGVINKKTINETIQNYAPYATISFLFLFYRVFIFESTRTSLNAMHIFSKFYINFFVETINMIIRVISDLYESLIGVWLNAFSFNISNFGYNDSIHLDNIIVVPKFRAMIYVIILIIAISYGLLLSRHKVKKIDVDNYILFYSIIGVFSLIFIWFGSRQIELNNEFDRYTLQTILSSLFIIIFIAMNLRNRYFFLCLLIGFCICKSIDTRNNYIKDWGHQKAFFEQIFWRLPDIEKGSLIVLDGMEFILKRDKALATPLNYIYSNDLNTKFPEYWIDFYPGFPNNSLDYFSVDTMVRQEGAFTFVSDPEKIIWINFSQQACLKLRYPNRKDIDFNHSYQKNRYPIVEKELFDIIEIEPTKKIKNVFGQDFGTKKCWCYYFEKADYYYYREDLENVIGLFNKVIQTDFRPNDEREWLIFYESAKKLNDQGVVDTIKEMTKNSIYSSIFI